MQRIRVSGVVCCLMVCFSSAAALAQQSDEFESLLASAQQAQARGDFEDAAHFYKKASNIHPEIAELKANLGLMYFQSGKNGEAVEIFRQAILLKPTLLVPNLFLGLSDLRLKCFEEAIPYLKRAALLKPKEVQAHLGLGEAYSATGQTRLAIIAYSEAIELDSGNADAWYRLGVSYLAQVEADSRFVFVRHKDSPFLQLLVAENFLEQRAFTQAEEAYKKTLSSSVLPPGTHAEYGFLLLNRHELGDSEREFGSELASDPGSLMAKLGMARLHLEQGSVWQSSSELAQIFNIDSGFLRSSANWFKNDLPQQKRSELLQALAEKHPSEVASPEIAGILADGASETNTGEFQQAATRVIENSVSSGRPDLREAADLYAAGKYRQCSNALAARRQLLGTDELRLMASCSYLTGEYRRTFDAGSKLARKPVTEAEGLYWEIKSAEGLATETLAHASEINSRSPKLHVLLGDVYRQRKFFPDAEKEYRNALALQPDDTGASFGLSLALLGDGQTNEALEIAKAALANNSDDPELNAVMGEILCARSDFPAAEPYLKKSLNTKPEYVAHVHALLGRVYAHTDRTEQAIAEFKLALADDNDGSIHYQIARLYLKIGDRQAANQAFALSEQIKRERVDRDVAAMQREQKDEAP